MEDTMERDLLKLSQRLYMDMGMVILVILEVTMERDLLIHYQRLHMDMDFIMVSVMDMVMVMGMDTIMVKRFQKELALCHISHSSAQAIINTFFTFPFRSVISSIPKQNKNIIL